MSDVTIVALIGVAGTIISGPVIRLLEGRWERRSNRRAELSDLYVAVEHAARGLLNSLPPSEFGDRAEASREVATRRANFETTRARAEILGGRAVVASIRSLEGHISAAVHSFYDGLQDAGPMTVGKTEFESAEESLRSYIEAVRADLKS